MQNKWSHRDFDIQDGLKPGAKHFQYFFTVSEKGEKRCNYCVWIEDEALFRFDPSKDFKAIASSNREAWTRWVREKIDEGEFKSTVMKFDAKGQSEIDLAEMKEHLSMD